MDVSAISSSSSSSSSDSDSGSSESSLPHKHEQKHKSSNIITPAHPSHLETYLNHRPKIELEPNKQKKLKSINKRPLNDTTKVSALLEALAHVCQWPTDQVKSDVDALTSARVHTVADLRLVSKKGWTHLPIPMVVAERLRICVWNALDYKQYVKNRDSLLLESVHQQLSSPYLPATKDLAYRSVVQVPASSAVHTANHSRPSSYWSDLARQLVQPPVDTKVVKPILDPFNTKYLISELLYDGLDGPIWQPSQSNTTPKPKESSTMTLDSNSSSSSDKQIVVAGQFPSSDLVHILLHTDSMEDGLTTSNEGLPDHQVSLPAGILGVCPGNTNRIQVRDGYNRVYEMDRFCPHKKYDLLKGGLVYGSKVKCPKHGWEFDLGNGGKCVNKHTQQSVDCRLIQDW